MQLFNNTIFISFIKRFAFNKPSQHSTAPIIQVFEVEIK